MQQHEYGDALNRAAANSDYSGMGTALLTLPPDFPNPALSQRMAAIAEMRSLVPPQAGMVLCTVPAGKGMLRAANGTRFTFWTAYVHDRDLRRL